MAGMHEGNVVRTPRWIMAFVVIAFTSRILDILTAPFAAHIIELASSRPASDAMSFSLPSILVRLASVETVARTLVLLGGLIALAGCTFLLCVLFGAPALQFLPLVAVTVHSEAILVTREMANLVLLSLQGPQVLNEWRDLLAVPGLDLLARGPAVHAGIICFLNGVNPFSIWYVATLSLGLHCATGITRGKALLISSCLLLLRAGVPALLLGIASSR